MARKKSSPLEDMVELASMMPWWAGLGLALITFSCMQLRRGHLFRFPA